MHAVVQVEHLVLVCRALNDGTRHQSGWPVPPRAHRGPCRRLAFEADKEPTADEIDWKTINLQAAFRDNGQLTLVARLPPEQHAACSIIVTLHSERVTRGACFLH